MYISLLILRFIICTAPLLLNIITCHISLICVDILEVLLYYEVHCGCQLVSGMP